MKLQVKKSDRKVAPEGLHPARLIQIVDEGTHFSEEYNKKESYVRLGFELIGVTFETEEGEEVNYFLSRTYSKKLSRKSFLRKVVEAVLGKKLEDDTEFELKDLLNLPCQVQVVHKQGTGKNAHETYANIEAVLEVGTDPTTKKKLKYEQATRDVVIFSLEEGQIDDEILATFPEKLQDRIMASEEYEAYVGGGQQAESEAEEEEEAPEPPKKKAAPAKVAPARPAAKAPAKKPVAPAKKTAKK